jgi:hypothetical protein
MPGCGADSRDEDRRLVLQEPSIRAGRQVQHTDLRMGDTRSANLTTDVHDSHGPCGNIRCLTKSQADNPQVGPKRCP